MSRKIEIWRHQSFMENAQTEPQVKAWFDMAFRPIGPYYQGKLVATGLTPTEIKIIMPHIIGIEPNEREFRKAVTDYFENILTNVLPPRIELEIGLEDDNLPLSETNLPLSPKDFVAYRHAIGHPHVALSLEQAMSDPTKKFYIVDPQDQVAELVGLHEIEDRATAAYFQNKDDSAKVDMVLTLMGLNVRELDAKTKLIKFKDLSRKDASLSHARQREQFQRFIDLCNDPKIVIKYIITELIGAQYLERIGTQISIRETGEILGHDLKEAIAFLENPKNSKVLNLLKANYYNLMKPTDPRLQPTTVEDSQEQLKVVSTDAEIVEQGKKSKNK